MGREAYHVAGPTFYFPTLTIDDMGKKPCRVGPTYIAGIKTEKIMAGIYAQYFFHLDECAAGTTAFPIRTLMNREYFFWYTLPDAWSVGFDPNITYDHKMCMANYWLSSCRQLIKAATR
jgi:hypothetical protein